jgi:hypothetical protein
MLALNSQHVFVEPVPNNDRKLQDEDDTLRDTIKNYGGIVDATITSATNMIVYRKGSSAKKTSPLFKSAKAKGVKIMTEHDFREEYIIGKPLKEERFFTIEDNGPNVCQIVSVIFEGEFLKKFEVSHYNWEDSNIRIEVPESMKRKLRVGAVFVADYENHNNSAVYGLWNGKSVVPLDRSFEYRFIPPDPAFDITSMNVPVSYWHRANIFDRNDEYVWFNPSKVQVKVFEGVKYIQFKTAGRTYLIEYPSPLGDGSELQLVSIGEYVSEDTDSPPSSSAHSSKSKRSSPVGPKLCVSAENFFSIEDNGPKMCQIVYLDLEQDEKYIEQFLQAGDNGFRTANICVTVPASIKNKLRVGAVFITDIETSDDNSIFGVWNGSNIVRINYDATHASIPEDPAFDVISMNVPVTFWYKAKAFDKFNDVIWINVSKCTKKKTHDNNKVVNYLEFKAGGKKYSFEEKKNDKRTLQSFNVPLVYLEDSNETPKPKSASARSSPRASPRASPRGQPSASPGSRKVSVDEVYMLVSKLSVTDKKEIIKRILASC